MAASFPVTFPSAVTSTPTTTLSSAQHNDNLHVKDRDEIIATQTKVGLGSSVASGTTVLLGTGGTQSAWGQITSTYIAAGSIATDRLAANATTQSVQKHATGPGTTTSSSYGTIPGMLGTLVTTGGEVKIELRACFSNTSAAVSNFFAVNVDGGTSYGEMVQSQDNAFYINSIAVDHTIPVGSLSAGTHVFAALYKTDGGTLATSTTRCHLEVREFKK